MSQPASAPAQAPPRLSHRKRALFAVLGLLIAAAVAFATLEVYLRVSRWEIRSRSPLGSLHRHHPVLGWELVPQREVVLEGDSHEAVRFEINGQGWRDAKEVALARAPGVARAVVLGDSFTWGWGVRGEDVYAERLETLSGAEVVNMGVNAFGTGQEWLLFRERGRAYAPDVVIVGFFVGNDFRDNVARQAKRPAFALGEGGRVVVSNVPVPRPFAAPIGQWAKECFVGSHFLSYQAARLKSAVASSDGAIGRAFRGLRSPAPGAADDAFASVELYRKRPGRELEGAVALSGAILGELQRDCAAAGAALLVLGIPTREMIDRAMWESCDTRDPGVDRDQPIAHLRGLCRDRGIAFVDPTPELRAADAGGRATYLSREGLQPGFHWNALGHDVAARALLAELERRGWLKPRK